MNSQQNVLAPEGIKPIRSLLLGIHSQVGGWHGDKHPQENEICVRGGVLTGEMGVPGRDALPVDFERSQGRHRSEDRWGSSFMWSRGTGQPGCLESRMVLWVAQKMKQASRLLE